MALMLALLAACSTESRTLASDQPQTPPEGPRDPRIPRYQDNVYQVAQGSRYFSWYGCATCHGPGATGARDLSDARWRHGATMDLVYRFIATGHPGAQLRYGDRIPVEQLWQLSAYVRDLPKHDPAWNRRAVVDAAGEPQGASWQGPLR